MRYQKSLPNKGVIMNHQPKQRNGWIKKPNEKSNLNEKKKKNFFSYNSEIKKPIFFKTPIINTTLLFSIK